MLNYSAITVGQSQMDLEAMKAIYEKRQPRLDSMIAEPSRAYQVVNATTSDNVKISGWLLKGSENKGTLLMVHGFLMNKSFMLKRAEAINNIGYSVLLMDLRARGESGGEKTSAGEDSVPDVLAMIEMYKQRFSQFGPLTLYGFSHGGRVVIYSAAQAKKHSIILESPPYSLTNSFKRTYHFPDVPNLDDGSLEKALKKLRKVPALVMMGDSDTAINDLEAKELMRYLRHRRSRLVKFDRTQHDVFTANNSDQYRQQIIDFLEMKR